MRFKDCTVYALSVAFIFSSCAASPVYTLAQWHETERVQQDLRGKRVEIQYKDDRIAKGYFYEATADTIRFYRKKNQQATFAVPAYEVRMIRVLASQETEIIVAISVVGALILLGIFAKGVAAGASSPR